MRWFFRVEYDGAPFAGWQSQRDTRTVQAILEHAFKTAVRAKCTVVGAGRTDAGVHAAAQGAHVDLPETVDIAQCERSVNGILPREIAVRDFASVPDSFHARFSARRRCYRYTIITSKSPLRDARAWLVTHRVDWKRVTENVRLLEGRHDFRAFCASNHGAKTTVCTVHEARLRRHGEARVLTITANRFLYKMVRSIAGTLVDIGRGALDDTVRGIIRSKDRARAGRTAPAHGLVLENVLYREV
ncbi:MAG: tRNA pseudouridine(38-40) synthase TruA [Chitinivibrionales bacterium]|nr:tRNA pseudouridine(38-40) synthase TruA [Chitinivibrionales bacterium]MBD3395966.1 tRNA pseudouridine(38-40) synthase TruA [Chitinivibrionales bacterium]